MDDASQYSIRSYQASDRVAVRKLCCETGFLGSPIDPVFQDRELFADFLTTYTQITNRNPLSCWKLTGKFAVTCWAHANRCSISFTLLPIQWPCFSAPCGAIAVTI